MKRKKIFRPCAVLKTIFICCIVFTSMLYASMTGVGLRFPNFPTMPGLFPLRSATIAHSEFRASQKTGTVVSNVNVFNGQPYYQVPLMTLNARNILFWNMTLTYNGSVIRPTLQSSNLKAVAGLYGLGWSMVSPYVAVSHMGTVTTMDDVIYCDLGPYGGGQIVQNSEGKFYLSSNPYIKINVTFDTPKPLSGFAHIISWQFTMPDGNRMFFGESENSRRTQRSRGNVIAAPSSTASQGEDYIYKYDLSRFTTFDESTVIRFEYSQVRESLTAAVSYVRESAVSAIYWQNAGETIDSIALTYGNLEPSEYTAYGTMESRDAQRLYETRFLSSIKYFMQGDCRELVLFDYGWFLSGVEDFKYLRELVGIRDSMVQGETRKWLFGYDDGAKMLSYVVLPDRSMEHFAYDKINVCDSASVGSPGIPDTMRKVSGDVVNIPQNQTDEYRNSVECTEEFCFALLSTNRESENESLFVQIYRNEGNYFSRPWNHEITGRKNPIFQFGSNYFVLTATESRLLKFYEWNGFDFVNRNIDIGGFVGDSTLLTGTIEAVYLQNNYIVILENDNNKRYIHLIVKDQITGKWKLLDSSKNCGFANTGEYGETIRDKNTDHCLEWNDAVFVKTSPNLFVVGMPATDVINIFSFDGANFHELSRNRNVFPDLGVQMNSGGSDVYTMNFQIKNTLINVVLSGNYLVIPFKSNGKEQVAILYFDGSIFLPIAMDSWDYPKDNGPMGFFVQNSYILGISKSISNVILWRKKETSSGLIFEKVDASVFPFDGENHDIYVSGTGDAFYLEEKYKESPRRVALADGSRYHNRLVFVPSDPSKSLIDYTHEIDQYMVGVNFSSNDPVVFYEINEKPGGGFCEENVSCSRGFYSRPRKYSSMTLLSAETTRETTLNIGNHWLGNVYKVSYPNRLMMSSVIDLDAECNLIGFGQYSGRNFKSPDSSYVVSKQWKHHGLDLTTPFPYTNFIYNSDSSVVEYNVHTQQLQFGNPLLQIVSTVGALLTSSRYNFVMDLLDSPLIGYARNLIGSVRSLQNFDSSGTVRSSNRFVFEIDSGKTMKWPDGLIVNRLDSTISTATDFYGNTVRSVAKNVLLDSLSGQFRGTVKRNGNRYLFSQRIFQTLNVTQGNETYCFSNPVGVYNYVAFDYDPVPTIMVADPDNVIFPDSVASASRAVYFTNKPHQILANYSWQPAVHMGTGYDPSLGYVLSDSIVSINAYGQVTEKQSRSVSGIRSDCVVYEGLRSLPTAIFKGAACNDVAASTAEHGALNDWEMAQTVLDSNQVYDGLYSFRVKDGFGPTRNIHLKEIDRYKYDYVVSAYGYSTGTHPVMMVELHREDGTVQRAFMSTTPVDESFSANKWQRYEVEIPYDSLVADGLFADPASSDYLRIWFGFGTPANDPSRLLYVDDFVAYPTSSTFTLKSYDTMGLPLSSTDSRFEKLEYVYDKNNRQRTVRDSKGRIYSDNAKHLLQENMKVNHD